jgi:hypothetical protein
MRNALRDNAAASSGVTPQQPRQPHGFGGADARNKVNPGIHFDRGQ